MPAQTDTAFDDCSSLPVNKTWLEGLIRREFNAASKIKSFKTKPIGEIGFVSYVSKVDLEYVCENEELPKALIIKIPAGEKLCELAERSPELQEYYNLEAVRRLHSNEVKFYKLFAQDGEHANRAPIPIPRCLYAEDMGDDGKGGLIILEFVEGRSISFNDDFTPEQIWTIVKHIAALHAFSMGTGFHRKFGDLDKLFYGPSEKLLTESFLRCREAYPSQFSITDDQIHHILESLDKVRYKISCSGQEQIGCQPVLALGDSQPNNVLFEVNESGHLGSKVAALIDFQFVCQGSCVYDLCSILFWGVDHKKFRGMTDKVLKLYLETLSNLTGGKTIMSFDDLKKEFHDFYPLFMSIPVSWFADPGALREQWGLEEDRIAEFIQRIKDGFGLA